MTTRAFAQDTEVSPERSRAEIERILQRYGADAFAYGYQDDRASIMFRAHGRYVRFEVPLPVARDFLRDRAGRHRNQRQAEEAAKKEERRRWRALALAVKAKLEVVDSGIASFEAEFLAHVVLPTGELVGDWLAPQIAEVYETGQMPGLLPGLRALPAGSR